MKVSKTLVGKFVEVQWMDPQWQQVSAHEIKEGRACLATWHECDIVRSVTDGVIQIMHSWANLAGESANSSNPDEVCFTPIPEALIEKLVTYVPAIITPNEEAPK